MGLDGADYPHLFNLLLYLIGLSMKLGFQPKTKLVRPFHASEHVTLTASGKKTK